MAAVKYVPLTTLAMAENCTPFLVLVLAFFTLKEQTSFLAFTATVVAVIGASMVVLNTTGSGSDDEVDSTSGNGIVLQSDDDLKSDESQAAYPLFVYILIIAGPSMKSTGAILMRILKKLDIMTVTSWQNFTLMIFGIVFVYATGSDLSILKEFDRKDWIALVVLGSVMVFAQKYFTVMT